MMGVAVIAFAFGIMLLAYLFLFGAIIGTFLYFVSWIRSKFRRPMPDTLHKRKENQGRIIDTDDWKHL